MREPLEACVSAYQYHLESSEAWLRTPRAEDLSRRGPTAGLPWQSVLRSVDLRSGLLLECRRSIRDQIAQQAEVYNLTKRHTRVFTLRMEATEFDFDGTMRSLFAFLKGAYESWLGRALISSTSINEIAPQVSSLVDQAARFDLSRHRHELEDGHLSSVHRKRQLRAILLNESTLVRELEYWRAGAGYDTTYQAHCHRYGLGYHDQAVADLQLRGDEIISSLKVNLKHHHQRRRRRRRRH